MSSMQSISPHRPRFQQVADRLRALIAAGELGEHSALPSERGIAEKYGISRMTARRALEALESEGLVYNEDRRGRFVSPRRLNYDVSNMVSFAADAQARGMDLEIELITVKETAADAELAEKLSVDAGEPLHEYTRLFRSNGYAIFLETECVIARRFPDLLDHDLRQSTTRLLERHYGTSARTGDIVIRMRGVRAEEAALMGLAISHPGIELEQVIRDGAGSPFCFGRQIWRGELAEFSARAIVNPENAG
ncbi:MAG: UTRA domain-containing protein [Gammaproteobacteria bacterium]|nr:GntR family transcriptional regulator [Gammaproteobacteria bacterium]NIP87627.1 GntR family transcriptional regulator [Gammaproteobacteria bacterium]NIR21952.1 GntR family transcriptional regulator [Gammaproteobacteria bacterium]NIS03648.1 GntR family transcriptional regulator [Gammaproteobacteria bacterium]NIU40663.1 UTRA domain-containing protein [Gammaproteobacteria bacterium]